MTRLGWLGPGVVVTGLAIGGLGSWYYASAAPVAGDVIDTLTVDATTSVVVRDEAGGERSFLELHDASGLHWQALIPHYAGSPGRPGVAWGERIVTVRVERGGEQELWALGAGDAVKVASLRLAPEHEPIPAQVDEPLTLTDHHWTFEIVSGQSWHQVVAIDLGTGKAQWRHDLGPAHLASATLDAERHTLTFGSASGRVVLDARTGEPASPP